MITATDLIAKRHCSACTFSDGACIRWGVADPLPREKTCLYFAQGSAELLAVGVREENARLQRALDWEKSKPDRALRAAQEKSLWEKQERERLKHLRAKEAHRKALAVNRANRLRWRRRPEGFFVRFGEIMSKALRP